MSQIRFSSTLPQFRRDELAELMFYNLEQHQVRSGIINAIDRFGLPEIVADGDNLRVRVEKLPDVQTLFAIDSDPQPAELAGVMIYARIDPSTLTLLHIGVGSDYSSHGRRAGKLLVFNFIHQLKQIARRITGITGIEVLHQSGNYRRMLV